MSSSHTMNQITPELRHNQGRVDAAVFGRDALSSLSAVSDSMERRREEKRLVAHYFDVPEDRIIMLEQVHGPDCVRVSSLDLPDDRLIFAKADASMTIEIDVVLVIRTADCLPVFFHTEGSGGEVLIGLLHAGWKGLTRGILSHVMSLAFHTIEQSQKQKLDIVDPLHIFPGPYIPGSAYEVGPEVACHFPLSQQLDTGKSLVDLYANARWLFGESLQSKKVEFIDPFAVVAEGESMRDRFFSHRRGDAERNLNAIRIREAPHG